MAELHLPPFWVTDELRWPKGRGVRVGIIGSGYDRRLRDPRVLPGVGFVDPMDDLAMLQTTDDHDRLGMGTACADLVLNVAPDARVVPIRIFGEENETSPAVLHAALVWATEQKLDVVCVTAGSVLEQTLRHLYVACEKAMRSGVVIVAAGHPDGAPSYPSIFANVIGVSSGRFSSPFHYRYDPEAGCEVEASGEDQLALSLGGRAAVKSGTMYAAANLAGVVALLREHHRGATLDEIRGWLWKFRM